MTPFRILSVTSIAVAMLATPAATSRIRPAKPHVPRIANAGAPLFAHHTRSHVRIPAPRVPARATAPSNGPGGVCDFGDNPMIC
jgi:hypothetical protein